MPRIRSGFPESSEHAFREKAQVLGRGRKTIAYVNSKNEQEVLAYNRYNGDELPPEMLKMLFYGQHILHDLFPTHFPSLKAIFSEQGQVRELQVRQRIVGEPLTDQELRHDSQIQSLCRDLRDILGGDGLDRNPGNFLRDQHGNVYYLDIDIMHIPLLFRGVEQDILIENITRKFGEEKARIITPTIRRFYALMNHLFPRRTH